MAGMSSRAVNSTVVYAQDTQPDVKRDGVMWVDTSEPSRPVYVYSSDTAAWEPTAPGNVTVSDTAPTGESEGHQWIDTSGTGVPVVKVLHSDGTWRRVGQTNEDVQLISLPYSAGYAPGFLG